MTVLNVSHDDYCTLWRGLSQKMLFLCPGSLLLTWLLLFLAVKVLCRRFYRVLWILQVRAPPLLLFLVLLAVWEIVKVIVHLILNHTLLGELHLLPFLTLASCGRCPTLQHYFLIIIVVVIIETPLVLLWDHRVLLWLIELALLFLIELTLLAFFSG